MKPVHDAMIDDNGSIIIEDNLSSHKIEVVMAFYKNEFSKYSNPVFLPANITGLLQVIA